MKKLMMVAVVVACVMHGAWAEDEVAPEGTQKVALKIASVETPTTRSTKWNPPQLNAPSFKALPFSEEDIQKAPSYEASKMIEANRKVQLENNRLQAAVAIQQYKDAMSHYKGMKAKLEATAFGRQILAAQDKFVGAAGEYFDPDCIEFFQYTDALGESDEITLISGGKSGDLMVSPYFIKLIFSDPSVKTMSGMISGTEVKRTTVNVALTYEVQRLDGKIITAGNVKSEKSERDTGIGGVSESALIADAIDEALEKAAKKINDYFVAKPKIKIIPAKKDKEFDEESATMEIDGVSQEIGEEISLLKGKHTITIDLDGYKQVGSIKFDIRKSGQIKIKLKKVEESKTEESKADEE